MDLSYIKCPYCEKEFPTLNSLRIHTSKFHKLTSQQVYIDLFCNGVRPTCKCGCGEETKFWTLQRGFADYKRGHIARINNNWGHNKKAQKKSQEVRREMWKNGEITPWCKGLTKETDERIKELAHKGSKTILANKELLEKRSKMMRENRLSGVVPTLTGSQHSQWKGGTSSLQAHVRSHVLNYWSRPIMKRDNYTCQFCGKKRNLCVHHNDENNRFAKILREAISVCGEYKEGEVSSFEIKEKITDYVVDFHVSNNVSGITLCCDCHMKLHSCK